MKLRAGELVMRTNGDIGMLTHVETHSIKIEWLDQKTTYTSYMATAQMLRNNYLAYRRRMEYSTNYENHSL